MDCVYVLFWKGKEILLGFLGFVFLENKRKRWNLKIDNGYIDKDKDKGMYMGMNKDEGNVYLF